MRSRVNYVLLMAAMAAACVVVVPALAARPHGPVVLGSKRFAPGNGIGWGKVAPRTISNGGDASGTITKVHWRHWGHRVARGHGRNSIFKPHGGYYRHPVRIKLKAHKLGQCPHSGRLAYKKLSVKIPRKPGGPLGPWRSWSGRKSICRNPYPY